MEEKEKKAPAREDTDCYFYQSAQELRITDSVCAVCRFFCPEQPLTCCHYPDMKPEAVLANRALCEFFEMN